MKIKHKRRRPPCIAMILISWIIFFGCAKPVIQIEKIVPADETAKAAPPAVRYLIITGFSGVFDQRLKHDLRAQLNRSGPVVLLESVAAESVAKINYDTVEDPNLRLYYQKYNIGFVLSGRATEALRDVRGFDKVEVKEGIGEFKRVRNAAGQWVEVEIQRTTLRPSAYVNREASVSALYKFYDVKQETVLVAGRITEPYNEKFGGAEASPIARKGLNELPAARTTLKELSAKVSARLISKIEPFILKPR